MRRINVSRSAFLSILSYSARRGTLHGALRRGACFPCLRAERRNDERRAEDERRRGDVRAVRRVRRRLRARRGVPHVPVRRARAVQALLLKLYGARHGYGVKLLENVVSPSGKRK